MKRTPVVVGVFVLAALIAYGAWLGILVTRQQTQLDSIEARLAQSPVAVLSPSPAARPTPVASSSSSPAFAELQRVTDNFGHTWIYSPSNQTANVLVNSQFVFTAVAQDPLNRPIEYAYTVGALPTESVLCNWGGPQCSWTGESRPFPAVVTVFVRAKGAAHMVRPCSIMDSCDALLHMNFLFGTPPP